VVDVKSCEIEEAGVITAPAPLESAGVLVALPYVAKLVDKEVGGNIDVVVVGTIMGLEGVGRDVGFVGVGFKVLIVVELKDEVGRLDDSPGTSIVTGGESTSTVEYAVVVTVAGDGVMDTTTVLEISGPSMVVVETISVVIGGRV
jgi:hypothetical protein